MNQHTDADELGTRLIHAGDRDRDLDSEVASDWFAVDSEAWRKLDIEERERNPNGRGGVKSISGR